MGKWDGIDKIWDLLDELDRQEYNNKLLTRIKNLFRRIFK